MRKIGISQIGISIPKYFISIEELSKKRKIPFEYGLKGLGVFQARIPYKSSIEDLATEALKKIDYKKVERFYVGTESDFDASKPLGLKILNKKLGLKIVPFQYKFACLAGLEALISACEYCAAHPKKSAIVLAFDRSIYREKDSSAELTQGCAAVALKVKENPRILIIDYQNPGQYAADINDFFVPIHSFPFPIVNGDLSKISFLICQKKAFEDWKRKNCHLLKKTNILDFFDYFVIHTPFPKIVEWISALFWRQEKEKRKDQLILKECLRNPSLFREYKKDLDKTRQKLEFKNFFFQKIKPSLKYNLFIGNSYTCSIFISLVSVLEKAKKGEKISLVGYGSGAGAICLKAQVVSPLKSDLLSQIKRGKKISIKEYEKWRRSLIFGIK